jgi:hypothetical protein
MRLDPLTTQWIASLLLVLSGVQGLVLANAARAGSSAARMLATVIALATIAFGIFMIVTLLGARI